MGGLCLISSRGCGEKQTNLPAGRQGQDPLTCYSCLYLDIYSTDIAGRKGSLHIISASLGIYVDYLAGKI